MLNWKSAAATLCALAFVACGKKDENTTVTVDPAKVGSETGAVTAKKTDGPGKVEVKALEPNKVKARSGDVATRTVAGAPTVTLISAGSDPKLPLRLTPTVGATQKSTMIMRMAMQMTMSGQEIPMKLPGMKMGMSSTVGSVNEAGDATYTFKLDSAEVMDEAGVNPMVASAMKDGISGIVGMNGKAVVTNRGYAKDAKLNLPANVNPQMKQMLDGFQQSMNQMSTPLPEQAVGVGAKWQVVQKIDQNGMKIDQTATFELLERKGNIAKTKFTLVQTAPAQSIMNDELPAGASAKLKSLKGGGSGTATLNLTKVMPSDSKANISSEVSMAISQGGQNMDMDMKMDINMQLSD